MKEIALKIEVREVKTKGATNSLRRQGQVPGVVYGAKQGPLAVTVNALELDQAVHGEAGSNVLLRLSHPDERGPVIIKEIQRDLLTDNPIHVDFQRITMTQKLELKVPLHAEGEAPGVKVSGGVLEHLLHEVAIQCLPKDIPQYIVVDVSNLEIGQAISLKDLTVPEGVELLGQPEQLVVHVSSPTILEEPTPEAVTAEATEVAAEPEVIKKGKKEEETSEVEPAKKTGESPKK